MDSPLSKNLEKKYRLIHSALHNPRAIAVVLDKQDYQVHTSITNGQRYLTWNKNTFMQANPNSNTVQGRLAAAGNQVTWIMRTGRKSWGLIVGDTIQRP